MIGKSKETVFRSDPRLDKERCRCTLALSHPTHYKRAADGIADHNLDIMYADLQTTQNKLFVIYGVLYIPFRHICSLQYLDIF